MTIARYTQRKMDDLERDGFTIHVLEDHDKKEEAKQRARIVNAAERLGVKVHTSVNDCHVLGHPPLCPLRTLTGTVTGPPAELEAQIHAVKEWLDNYLARHIQDPWQGTATTIDSVVHSAATWSKNQWPMFHEQTKGRP